MSVTKGRHASLTHSPTLRFHVVDDYAREDICGINVKFFPGEHQNPTGGPR